MLILLNPSITTLSTAAYAAAAPATPNKTMTAFIIVANYTSPITGVGGQGVRFVVPSITPWFAINERDDLILCNDKLVT